jgi:hypothetical protein
MKINLRKIKIFILGISFFYYQIDASASGKSIFIAKSFHKGIQYVSLWNWIPETYQKRFFDMNKKNSFLNHFLHYSFFTLPFLYTGYELQKRIRNVYNNNLSAIELFFNFKKGKTKTSIEKIVFYFLKNQNNKKAFAAIIKKSIEEASNTENNYFIYIKKYLKIFFAQLKDAARYIGKKNENHEMEKIRTDFTWKLINLKERYNLKKLKDDLKKEIEKNEEENEEEEIEKNILKLYKVIQKIQQYPEINFLAKNDPYPQTILAQLIKQEKTRKKEDPEFNEKEDEYTKIKDSLYEILDINNKPDNTTIITQIEKEKIEGPLFSSISLKDETKDDTVMTFMKKELPSIIGFPALHSPKAANIFTASLLLLNTYPWLYFSDIRAGLKK